MGCVRRHRLRPRRTEASTLKPPEPCQVSSAGGIELVEESLAPEVAEDAFLDNRLHLSDAIGRQVIGLVKRDLAVVGPAEHAVEHDEVVMRVDVEGGAEPMKEADGSELGARRCSWAGAPERRANRAQQRLPALDSANRPTNPASVARRSTTWRGSTRETTPSCVAASIRT